MEGMCQKKPQSIRADSLARVRTHMAAPVAEVKEVTIREDRFPALSAKNPRKNGRSGAAEHELVTAHCLRVRVAWKCLS